MSPRLFAIYMDDLSVCLTQCKAERHLNETNTNHVMYADEILKINPSAIIALQKRLNLCYKLYQSILFSPHLYCIVFSHVFFAALCK